VAISLAGLTAGQQLRLRHVDGHPIADVTFWDDPRQARGWMAKQRELFPELGYIWRSRCHGSRQIQEIVDLVRSRDEPPISLSRTSQRTRRPSDPPRSKSPRLPRSGPLHVYWRRSTPRWWRRLGAPSKLTRGTSPPERRSLIAVRAGGIARRWAETAEGR